MLFQQEELSSLEEYSVNSQLLQTYPIMGNIIAQ